MKNRIACCKYPTTVLFVDDKKLFLDRFTSNLSQGKMAFKNYIDPTEALEEIKKHSAPFALQQATLTNVTEKYADGYVPEQAHVVVDVDASKIYPAIYSQDRFSNISVVVVDYAMPIMNGLEFARQAREVGNKFLKIIMLTGEADEVLAIQAFNEGVIDKFIKKTHPSCKQILRDAIAELEKKYFHETSHALITALSANKDCCLDEDVFVDFFNGVCKEKNICEYYLADDLGSFLLADQDGNTFWLIVNNKNMLDNYASVANSSEYPPHIVQALQNREKVLFLLTEKNLYLSVSEWDKFMHPAQEKLVGCKDEFYCSLVAGKKVTELKHKKIVSYESYLDR